MKKTRFLLIALATAGALLTAQDKKETRVAAGEIRSTAINAFNSSLIIQGRVDESIFLIGGKLVLEGEVSGDVICIASQVSIGERAVIGQDLIVIGGRLAKAERCRIGGQLYRVRTQKDLKKIASSLLPFLPETGGMTFFKIVKIFFWLILALLTLLILPAPVGRAAAMLAEAPLRQLLLGLAALLAFMLLLLAFLLLSIVLVGIPLLIALIAVYFLLQIFGRAVIFYFIGNRIAATLRLKVGASLFVVLGGAAYALLKFLPFPAALLLIILDVFAIGVSVSFLLARKKPLS